jgi:hypothetical protein
MKRVRGELDRGHALGFSKEGLPLIGRYDQVDEPPAIG